MLNSRIKDNDFLNLIYNLLKGPCHSPSPYGDGDKHKKNFNELTYLDLRQGPPLVPVPYGKGKGSAVRQVHGVIKDNFFEKDYILNRVVNKGFYFDFLSFNYSVLYHEQDYSEAPSAQSEYSLRAYEKGECLFTRSEPRTVLNDRERYSHSALKKKKR